MNIKATIHADGVMEIFKSLHKQAPIAIAVALTRTGQIIKNNVLTEMKKVFDRPTPRTLNSLQLTPATKNNLIAQIWFKGTDGSGTHYLEPQVYGGPRKQKRSEIELRRAGILFQSRTVPGRAARLNKYGNMSTGQIIQALTAMRALRGLQVHGYEKYALRKGTKNLFYAKPGGRLFRGIWERTHQGLRPILMFVPHVQYKKRLPYFEIARRIYDQNFRAEFNKAFDQAVATAHYKGKW